MKTLFIITLIFSTTFCFAADSLEFRQQEAFNYLNDSDKNMVSTGCGYIGFETDNLYYLKVLITGRRFDLIIKLLDSKTPATRFLSAQTLILANKKKKWELDELTLSKVMEIKLSKSIVNACYGCMAGFSYPIFALLTDEKKPLLANQTRDLILVSLK